MSFIAELKRRNVIRMAGLYLVGAWLVTQVAGTVLPMLAAPAWMSRTVVFLLAMGLVPALVFAWVFELTPEGLRRESGEPATKSTERRSPQTSRRMERMTLVLFALALGYFAFDKFVLAPKRDAALVAKTTQAIGSAKPAPAGNAAETASIAVLPFVNMSADPAQEYFSDGLSEELSNLLAQLPQLRVIARTSSFSFKGKEADAATIAKALNVAHLLEGSVRKSGDTLRITAQLIRASDSSHLWSQTYDRELTDVFKVQDEIARSVVAALRLRLLPDQALVHDSRSGNPEAYNLLLIADQFFNRQNPADWKRAENAYLKAIALDPGYGAAYARLAAVRFFLADSTVDAASKQAALEFADKAVAMAPTLADAYAARGVTRLSFSRDWSGAQADLERALAIDASDVFTQIVYWRLLLTLDRQSEAVSVARKATELDPLNTNAWTALGRSLNGVGDYSAARVALERAVEISPASGYASFHLGLNDLLQDKAQLALATFQQGPAGTGYRLAGIAMAEHSLGHPRESERALQELIERFPGSAYQTAETYAWCGETDKAFQWLEVSLERNDGGLTFLKADPLMAGLTGDPRYAALLRKLNLPQ